MGSVIVAPFPVTLTMCVTVKANALTEEQVRGTDVDVRADTGFVVAFAQYLTKTWRHKKRTCGKLWGRPGRRPRTFEGDAQGPCCTGAYTGGVHRCQWTPLEVSSFVSNSTAYACALRASTFSRSIGRVSSHAHACMHATFIQLSRIWSLQSAQDRVALARGSGEASYWLSGRGQGGSFRCKTVSTASVREGAMMRRRASTATLASSPSKTRSVECRATDLVAWRAGPEGISERNSASKIDQHHRRSTSRRCWAAADRSPAADIVWELRSSYSLLRIRETLSE